MLGSILRYGDVPTWRAQYYRLFGVPHIGMRIKQFALGAMLLSHDRPTNILDAGCGAGYYAFWLAESFPDTTVTAVDIDERLIQEAKKLKAQTDLENLSFACVDLRSPSERQAFDLILSIDVLEHVVEDEQMLDSLYQGLKPGGMLIVHVPKRHQLQHRVFGDWVPWGGHGHVRDEYTEQEIRDKVESAGFALRELVYTFGRISSPFWEIGSILRRRHPMLNYLAFPFLASISYLDHLVPQHDGNGLLLRAVRLPAPDKENVASQSTTRMKDDECCQEKILYYQES